MKIIWRYISWANQKTLHKNSHPVATDDATEDDDTDTANTDDQNDVDAYNDVDAHFDPYLTMVIITWDHLGCHNHHTPGSHQTIFTNIYDQNMLKIWWIYQKEYVKKIWSNEFAKVWKMRKRREGVGSNFFAPRILQAEYASGPKIFLLIFSLNFTKIFF